MSGLFGLSYNVLRYKNSNVIVFIVSLLMFSVSSTMLTAQTLHPFRIDSVKKKSEVRISIWYTSDYVFMGRADSAKAPYVSPYIGYFHKSGLFINGSLSYLTGEEKGRIDLYKLKAGYDYFGKKIEAGITITEYFFNDYSYSVQSEMSTSLGGYVGYDFSAFMIYADAGLGISESTDVFLGAEINRRFYILRNKLRIIPAFYINAGSQEYYDQYYSERSAQTGSSKGKGSSGKQTTSTNDIKIYESSKFQLLDYEADLQVSYKIKKARLYVSTTWTFPVNPATVVSDQETYQEDLKDRFYWSTGIRFTL